MKFQHFSILTFFLFSLSGLLKWIGYLNLYANCCVFNKTYKRYIDETKERYMIDNELNVMFSNLMIKYYSLLVWFKRVYFFGRYILSLKLNFIEIKVKNIEKYS